MRISTELDRKIMEFRRENRGFMPSEIYATKQFIRKLKKEINANVPLYCWGPREKQPDMDGAELIYHGVKIKEIINFIITK